MKYWQRLSGQQRPSVDEHDMPTEPVPYPHPAQEPGYAQGLYDPGPYDERTTVTPPPARPPQGGRRQIVPPPQWPAWNQPPYVPPDPRPQPKRYREPEPTLGGERRGGVPTFIRILPGLIAVFFVIVQLALFARLVMKFILHTPDDQQWVTALYSFSTVFLVPVQWLALQIHLPFTLDPELYVLPAILLYGILARILVGMARFIVRSF